MRFDVITLFPELVMQLATGGVVSRGINEHLLELHTCNPRDYTHDRHRTVDDRPYGGGPGMVMKPEPLAAAIDAVKAEVKAKTEANVPVVYLSPQGEPLRQALAEELSGLPGMILLAGRYEGVDERLLQSRVDREISVGDFVVSGGELPAMLLIDAVARLIPGVLGHEASAAEDSFSTASQGLLDCPHYTRPETFEGMAIPSVLASGDHEKIRQWRLQQSVQRTWQRRPDLLSEQVDAADVSSVKSRLSKQELNLTVEQQQLLDDIKRLES